MADTAAAAAADPVGFAMGFLRIQVMSCHQAIPLKRVLPAAAVLAAILRHRHRSGSEMATRALMALPE